MGKRPLIERIGVDAGRRRPAEEALEWAAANRVFYLDIQADIAPNSLESFDDARCKRVRDLCERHEIHLGLHTLSGVNVAEFSPFCRGHTTNPTLIITAEKLNHLCPTMFLPARLENSLADGFHHLFRL